MSVTVKIKSRLDVLETLTAALASDKNVLIDGASTEKTLNSATTVPATKVAAFTKALSTGAATIDLTALTGTNGATVDFTGLKVQAAKFINPSTNANAITVTFGAATAYLLGGAAFKWILAPGQELLFFGNDAAPDVSASLKNIDLAGTGSQALTVVLVAG